MADLPITQVGRIDGLSIGRPSIANTGQGVSAKPAGFGFRSGIPMVLHADDAHRFKVSFNIDFAAALTNAKSVIRFTFGGPIVQSKIGLGDQSSFGLSKVAAGAQLVTTKSWTHSRIGIPDLGPAQSFVHFNFNDELKSGEYYFHFGSTSVITRAGGISAFEIKGVQKVEITLSIKPQGIYTETSSLHGVFDASNPSHQLDFNFASNNILDFHDGFRDFVFGGARLTTKVTVGDNLLLGVHHQIFNAADGVAPTGMRSRMKVGYPAVRTTFEDRLSGISLDLGFNQHLRPSNPMNVPFYFYFDYEVPVQGTEMTTFGFHEIRNEKDILLPHPILSAVFGDVNIKFKGNSPQLISLNGFLTDLYGRAEIAVTTKYIKHTGQKTDVFGEPEVNYGTFYSRVSGFNAELFGKVDVSHFLRFIQTGRGIDPGSYGEAWVSYGQRNLVTDSIPPITVPIPTVGPKIVIRPEGLNATLFGERIIPEIQRIYPQGFKELYGLPDVALFRRYIRVTGEDRMAMGGIDKIYNSTQYITMYYFQESGLNPPEWSKWIYVENSDRVITTHGTFFQNLGRPLLELGATALSPRGFESLNIGKSMVADRIRYVQPEVIDTPDPSRWLAVHNAARVLGAAPIEPEEGYGLPKFQNTRRYFRFIGAFESLEFGTPMVAYHTRELWIESRHSIQPPQVPLPKLELWTRYIEVLGNDYYATGSAELVIRWNKVTTRWSHKDLFGMPEMRNLTPELRTRGAKAEEFGRTKIRLEWEEMNAVGLDQMLFGKAFIAYRTKNIRIDGIVSNVFGLGTKVIKTASPPYTPQYIYLGPGSDDDTNSLPHNGIGFEREDQRFGRAEVRSNVIEVPGWSNLQFGNPVAHANGIIVDAGIFGHYFGTPQVFTARQLVYVYGIEPLTKVSEEAIVSPAFLFTETFNEHKMGGNTSVTHQHRKLFADGRNSADIGRPVVDWGKRYVRPAGFATLRMGWLVFPSTEVIEVDAIEDGPWFGKHNISHPPYTGPQAFSPRSIQDIRFGQTYIELQHREVKVLGFDSMEMGYSRPPYNPYMWQSLRIGPHIPTAIGNYVATLFGTAWISNWIREVLPEGFSMFASEYDYMNFDKRMHVHRTNIYNPSTQTFMGQGFVSDVLGIPNIRLAVHYIRPDGNSDQFRKGVINDINMISTPRSIDQVGVMFARIGIAQISYQDHAEILSLSLDVDLRSFDGNLDF